MENDILIFVDRDENNSIIRVVSSIFLQDTQGYEQIDQWGEGEDRYLYAHADNGEYVQVKYGKPLYDEQGRPNYHDDWVDWTEEEKADKYPILNPQPSELEKLKTEQEVTAQALQELMMVMLGGEING